MLATNRGRMVAQTLKALPEDTQHDITGGTYRGPLAQEFRSWCGSEKDTPAGFSQNHMAPRVRLVHREAVGERDEAGEVRG
jgi:hypothetical protein